MAAGEKKEQLLELLEAHRGSFLSGEDIAQALCVSRAAVWKAIRTLRQAGYPIEAVTNRGYCLAQQTDILSLQGVRRALGEDCRALTIDVLPTVESTNAHIRELARAQGGAERVLIAGEQTQGRGRRGRVFYSPKDTGIYLSLLLRPAGCTMQRATRFTAMAAAAVCEAIEAISGEQAQIKWVNDIYMRGKKVCGILTEASVSMESGDAEFVVLGIGVNVYAPAGGFPEELRDIAGAVFETPQSDGKNRLAAEIIRRMMDAYAKMDFDRVAAVYRKHSMVLGKHVTVLPEDRSAYAEDIDEDCRLLVRYEDGQRACLSCGEIRILI